MSTAYPLSCVAMELAAQLEERRLDLSLEWIPRGDNAEADALADGRVEGFDPALRAGASVAAVTWKVLPSLLRTWEAFCRGIGKSSLAAGSAHDSKALAGSRLRDREPW